MKFSLPIFCLVFLLSQILQYESAEAQSPPLQTISSAISAGNAKELARYFDANVEITIRKDEEVYSRTQAELVLKDFFARHAPQSFKMIHEGNSAQGAQFGIGTLVTRNGTFRTYVYIRQKQGGFQIQEIRFEED